MQIRLAKMINPIAATAKYGEMYVSTMQQPTATMNPIMIAGRFDSFGWHLNSSIGISDCILANESSRVSGIVRKVKVVCGIVKIFNIKNINFIKSLIYVISMNSTVCRISLSNKLFQ
jgi:hypothetical protein